MTQVIHKLINKDGKQLVLPPYSALTGADMSYLGHPDVYEANSLQQYPLGTIFRDGFRTYVYTRHSSATPSKSAGYLVKTTAAHKDLTDSVISGAAGANTCIINYGTSCAADKYAGGFMGIKGGVYGSYYIITNTVQNASNHVIFIIDHKWKAAIATTDDVVLTENPYKEVVTHLTGLDCAMWMGAIAASYRAAASTHGQIAASDFFWVQTWGPNNMMHPHNTWEGAEGEQIQVYGIHGNAQQVPAPGTAIVHGSTVPGTQQVIGLAYAESGGADYSVGTTVWLTIQP